MKRLPFYVLALVLAGGFTSCSKDDKDDPTPATKTELLTAKSWRLTADSSIEAGETTATDDYATLEACEKDNFIKFASSKVVTFDEGATKCDPTDPQTLTGSWDLNSGETQLFLTDPNLGLPVPFEIVELTSSTLKMKVTFFGTTTTRTYTSF